MHFFKSFSFKGTTVTVREIMKQEFGCYLWPSSGMVTAGIATLIQKCFCRFLSFDNIETKTLAGTCLNQAAEKILNS